MSDLKGLIKDLKSVIASGDLEKAFERLEEVINEDSSTYDTVIVLMGQYNRLMNSAKKRLIDMDRLDRKMAQISDSLNSTIDDLTQEDVNPGTVSDTSSDGKAEYSWDDDSSSKTNSDKPLKLFISYSHKNEEYKDRLKDELIVLERVGKIEIWDDRKLLVGDDFDKVILHQMETADILCLLVTRDFIKSNYIWTKELKKAIQRHEDGEARVFPIIIKKVPNFRDLPFSHLNVAPTDAKPVTEWEDEEDAWANVGEGITKLVNALRGT